MKAIYAVVALLLTGGTISPNTEDEKHIEYGAKFHHVATIRCEVPKTDDNISGLVAASCVIVSPNHVVTAAHVVRDSTAWVVTTGDGKERSLKRVSTHPDYGKGGGSFDLAVGYTDDSFDMKWYPAIYGDRDERGRTVSIAGYGMKGNLRDGITGSDGKRRAGSNTIDSAVEDYLICSVIGPPWTSLEFQICSGDSGGGLFIGNKLAGINSSIQTSSKRGKPRAIYGEESVHVRLSSHREWLLGEIRCNE